MSHTFQTGTVKYATWDIATGTGNVEVIAAVAAKKIRVLFFVFSASATQTVRFESEDTELTGSMRVIQSPFVAPYNEAGWFETAAGEALEITTTGSAITAGVCGYVEV